MQLERLTVFLVSIVLLATAGCTSDASLTNLGGLLPRADIPNVPDQQTTASAGPQSLDPVEPAPAPDSEPPASQPAAEPRLAATEPVAPEPQSQPAAPAPQTVKASPPTAAPKNQTAGTISFTPVIGAPVSAIEPLSRQLGTAARNRGLTIIQSASADSDHILKGYFSASNDGDRTTVAFVWDIMDNQGNRQHRIHGEQVAPGAAGDPWEVVQASTMESIATTTIEEYVSWRSRAGS